MTIPNPGPDLSWNRPRTWPRPTGFSGPARILGIVLLACGALGLLLAPLLGPAFSARLWGIEPLTYIGAMLIITGLTATTVSYLVPELLRRRNGNRRRNAASPSGGPR